VAQDGKELVPKGQSMTDAQLGAMNYYVKGVASTLPKN
jgi:hypothetical protein